MRKSTPVNSWEVNSLRTMMNKNALLISTFFIGKIPSLFFGMSERLNLSFFVERSTRLDFFAMYYVNAVSFLILAYCIRFNRGIHKWVSSLILTITALDLLHLMFFAKQGFGSAKIGIALLIVAYSNRLLIINRMKSLLKKWQM